MEPPVIAAIAAGTAVLAAALFFGIRKFLFNMIDKRIEQFQSSLIEKQIFETENMYKQVRGWRHDYRNHIQNMKIMVCDYNVVIIFSSNIGRYKDFFDAHGITRTKELVTAWDTFSQENPGCCCSYAVNGRNVYALPDSYKEWGMYMAERRVE